MQRILAIFLAIALLAVAAMSQQRPLLTEDVDIVPEGSVNLGVGVDFFQNSKFPLSGIKGDETRVGDIRLRVGLSKNVELQIEGVFRNFVAINSFGPSNIPLNTTGFSTSDGGDFTVSTKIKLRNETARTPAVGLKLGFQMPNTDQSRGIGTNQINIFGKVLMQKKFGSVVNNTPKMNLMGSVGLGIFTSPIEQFSQNDMLLYGFGGIYRLSDRVNIVSDVNGRLNTRSFAPIGTESQGQFRVGTQIRASNLRFDAAAVMGLTKFSPRTGIIFGVTYQSAQIFTPAQ